MNCVRLNVNEDRFFFLCETVLLNFFLLWPSKNYLFLNSLCLLVQSFV